MFKWDIFHLICACCLLSFHLIPLRKVLPSLFCHWPGICKHRTDPAESSLLKAPISRSFSSYKKCRSPLLTPVNFSRPCCSKSLSLLGPVLGYPVQHSGWLTSAEQRGRTASLRMLVMLFLMQSGLLWAFFAVRAHCWLVASLLSLGSFSANMHGIIPAKCSTSLFPCIEFHEATVGPFLSLSRSFWMADNPLMYQLLLVL